MSYTPFATSANATSTSGQSNAVILKLSASAVLTKNRIVTISGDDADYTITLSGGGLNVSAIGNVTPGTGSFTTVGVGIATQSNAGIYVNSAFSANGNYGIVNNPIFNFMANSTGNTGQWNAGTVATGTYTGLIWVNTRIATGSKTGTGTISEAYQFYIDPCMAATTKWGIYQNSTDANYFGGTFRMAAYGAGTATFDASGNITSVSDERAKRNIRPFSTGLSALLGLRPILHGYAKTSGLDQTRDDYAGFSAQNVRNFIPEAVSTDPKGMLSLSHAPILATLTNAVQELHVDVQAEIKALKKRLIILEAHSS